MPILHASILGIVQGLTEFFPVSSSGHLILVPRLLHWADQGLAFDTVMHLGTLTALLWFFRIDLLTLFRQVRQQDREGTDARRFVLQIIVATIPALALGFLFKDLEETYGRNAWLVAGSLAGWGLVLLAADRFTRSRVFTTQNVTSIRWKQAIAVGLAQPLSLIPGTSRSGITMTAGLFAGLSRETAARFSFFLSMPITAAAGFYGLFKVVKTGTGGEGVLPLIVGFLVAAIAGAWAIRFLLSFVAKRSYDVFAYYRVALALLVVLVV